MMIKYEIDLCIPSCGTSRTKVLMLRFAYDIFSSTMTVVTYMKLHFRISTCTQLSDHSKQKLRKNKKIKRGQHYTLTLSLRSSVSSSSRDSVSLFDSFLLSLFRRKGRCWAFSSSKRWCGWSMASRQAWATGSRPSLLAAQMCIPSAALPSAQGCAVQQTASSRRKAGISFFDLPPSLPPPPVCVAAGSARRPALRGRKLHGAREG